MNGDGSLEGFILIRALVDERLPPVSFALDSTSVFLSWREIDNFVVCFVHNSGQLFVHQTPGRRPPQNTGFSVDTVNLGWCGAPNERATFRFHGAVVDFVDRSVLTT